MAISQGRRPIQWSEVFDHFKTDLNKGTVVHIWKSVTNVTEVIKRARCPDEIAAISLQLFEPNISCCSCFALFCASIHPCPHSHLTTPTHTAHAPGISPLQVLADGYNVLINVADTSNGWYLDHLSVNWTQAYSNDPCDSVPDALCPMILGGNGEMWGGDCGSLRFPEHRVAQNGRHRRAALEQQECHFCRGCRAPNVELPLSASAPRSGGCSCE